MPSWSPSPVTPPSSAPRRQLVRHPPEDRANVVELHQAGQRLSRWATTSTTTPTCRTSRTTTTSRGAGSRASPSRPPATMSHTTTRRSGGYETYFGAIAKPNGKRLLQLGQGQLALHCPRLERLRQRRFAVDPDDVVEGRPGRYEQGLYRRLLPSPPLEYGRAGQYRRSRAVEGDDRQQGGSGPERARPPLRAVLPAEQQRRQGPGRTVEIIGGMAGASPYDLGPAESKRPSG